MADERYNYAVEMWCWWEMLRISWVYQQAKENIC